MHIYIIYSIRMNKYRVYVCGNVHGRKNKEKVALRRRLEVGKRKSKHTETSVFSSSSYFPVLVLPEHQNFIL